MQTYTWWVWCCSGDLGTYSPLLDPTRALASEGCGTESEERLGESRLRQPNIGGTRSSLLKTEWMHCSNWGQISSCSCTILICKNGWPKVMQITRCKITSRSVVLHHNLAQTQQASIPPKEKPINNKITKHGNLVGSITMKVLKHPWCTSSVCKFALCAIESLCVANGMYT